MPATVPEIQPVIFDPLLAQAELPLQGRFYPLGFSLDVRTNSDQLLTAAEQSWPDATKSFPDPPLQLSIGVTVGNHETATPPPTFRSRGHLISIMSGPEDFLVCDFRTGSGFGWFRPSTIADAAFFRFHFLEAAVLSMLDQLQFASVHGAMVARPGCGVLLCGDSLAGKSTLAFACARAGWTLVSDDATYLLRNRIKPFAIGNPHALRFRPDAPILFPELHGKSVATRPNGKEGIEVFVKDFPQIRTSRGAIVDHIVFLNRAENGGAHLSPCSSDEALSRLSSTLAYGQQEVRAAQEAAYTRLSRLPVWHLNYSGLDDAINSLDELAGRGE